MNKLRKIWDRLFLIERPSLSLSFFRLAVALTTGFHVLPTFIPLADNYLSTAYKTYNTSFFPIGILDLVQKSPDWVVIMFVWIFVIFWFLFLIGLWSQVSAIIMTLSGYYFYALNSFHIGTLSWDILLVTLFLICITNYHGDYFSVDCLLRGGENAYKKRRPYFIQRLLQMQVGFTYFYTALYKITAEGNWIKDNPIYYLMNYPMAGVMKTFILKDVLMHHPQICYAIGFSILVVELSMVFLLFNPKTRLSAIYLGIIFHILLILTLDVPAIFFFLFPAQLLLFINPEQIVSWIDRKRQRNRLAGQGQLLYDGQCEFCLANVKLLKIMDIFETLNFVDLHKFDFTNLPNQNGGQILNKEQALSQIYLIEPDGQIYGGFEAFRILSFKMPMLYPFILLFYFPGMGLLGPVIYRFVAQNRYLFHLNRTCSNHSCFRP